MKYSPASMSALSLVVILFLAFWLVLQQHPSSIDLAVCLGLFFAVLVPGIFMIVRHQMRINRIRAAELFRQNFDPGAKFDLHFEFLTRKYSALVPATGQAIKPDNAAPDYPFTTPQDWFLLAASIPFTLFTAAGIFVLFLPADELPKLLGGSLGSNILSVGGLSEPSAKDYENAVTIASLAFAGAFLYCLRLFLKSLLAFDLSAITFLRAFAHMLFATMLAVVIWRVAPDTRSLVDGVTQVQSAAAMDRKAVTKQARPSSEEVSATTRTEPVPKLWLLLAFAAGFIPDAAFSWIARQARLTLSRRYARVAKQTVVAPLTVIDGIDFLTAYRLEERKIAGVQNLAAANPIMLHVETSCCIFTIMDWIAQAQLCAAVGPQRFLLLRRLNLRTIFDLEHAVLDPSAPMGLKQMVGAVLLAHEGRTSILRDFGIRPLDVTYRDFDKAMTSWVNVEVIEHLVRLMMDDLYVHRFRQIWQDIEASMDIVKPEEPPRQLKISASQTAMKTQHTNGHGHDGYACGEVPAGVRAMSQD